MAHEHRYYYTVHLPERGLVCEGGWTFGPDMTVATEYALADLRKREPRRAASVAPSDVYLKHCSACSCLPPHERRW